VRHRLGDEVGGIGTKAGSIGSVTSTDHPEGPLLKEDRNLLLIKREKACLIRIFSTNAKRETVAYRSFDSLSSGE
jgi:hypothetical protein